MDGSRARLLATSAFAASLVLAAAAAPAAAQNIQRSNWVPNMGSLAGGQQYIGDLWTFTCPANGSVSVAVDTRDDTEEGTSNIDPFLIVMSQGRLLATADDETGCTFEPVCGFSCPEVEEVACGVGTHAIVVFDGSRGAVAEGAVPCAGGGGYDLFVQVLDADGGVLTEQQVGLGGGPDRRLPRRIGRGVPVQGPAVDDEGLPFFAPNQARATPQAAATKEGLPEE